MNSAYLLWMLGSVAVALVTAIVLTRRKLSCSFALLSWPLGLVLGVILSKLLYMVTQVTFVLADGVVATTLDLSPRTWCFAGGCLGAILGVVLTAKGTRTPIMVALNALAPVGALLVMLTRLGCFFLQEDMTGLGTYVDYAPLTWFPISLANDYGEHYIAAFLFEAVCALAVMVLSLVCYKKDIFLRTLFALCLMQVFCESLHGDSMAWMFVKIEQLISMLVVLGVMIVYVLRARKRAWWPVWATLGSAMLFVAIEFGLDKTEIPRLLLYAVMILWLVGLAVVRKKADANATVQK